MNTLSESEIEQASAAVSKLIAITSDELESRGESLAVIEGDGPLDVESFKTVQSMSRAARRLYAISQESRWLNAARFLEKQLSQGITTEPDDQ